MFSLPEETPVALAEQELRNARVRAAFKALEARGMSISEASTFLSLVMRGFSPTEFDFVFARLPALLSQPVVGPDAAS
jgi:hypothetical protein